MDSTAQTDPRNYDIINETASMGDAWFRQPKQALVTMISSTKLHPRVTLGFDTQTAPRDYDIINETAATGEAWIRQPIQPLGTEISSTKLHPQVTHGFDSPKNP